MDIKKIEQILRHYSPEKQTIKAIEEMAELQKELAKLLTKQGDKRSMMEELADVFIMLTQIGIIFDVDAEELDSIIAAKLDRQLKRIKKEA